MPPYARAENEILKKQFPSVFAHKNLNFNQTFRGYSLFISGLKATEKSGALKFLCSNLNFSLPFICVFAQHIFFELRLQIPQGILTWSVVGL